MSTTPVTHLLHAPLAEAVRSGNPEAIAEAERRLARGVTEPGRPIKENGARVLRFALIEHRIEAASSKPKPAPPVDPWAEYYAPEPTPEPKVKAKKAPTAKSAAAARLKSLEAWSVVGGRRLNVAVEQGFDISALSDEQVLHLASLTTPAIRQLDPKADIG